MPYYVADYRKTNRGFLPVFPEGTGFLCLASPGAAPAAPWGLFDCDREIPLGSGVRAVSVGLRLLLDSGKGYPPALAVAQCEAWDAFGEDATVEEFLEGYAQSLRKHLDAQPQDGYLLRECAGDEFGYPPAGMYYWVLDQQPEDGFVRWVTEEYEINRSPASDFNLRDDQASGPGPSRCSSPQRSI